VLSFPGRDFPACAVECALSFEGGGPCVVGGFSILRKSFV